MKCYRCGKEVTELKSAMIFWKTIEAEGTHVYEDFEIAHKQCKPRERWEMSWDLGWFSDERQVVEWMATIVPRAVRANPGGESRLPESLVHVIVDLSKTLIKGEAGYEGLIER